jgi:ATP-dependent Zn protease
MNGVILYLAFLILDLSTSWNYHAWTWFKFSTFSITWACIHKLQSNKNCPSLCNNNHINNTSSINKNKLHLFVVSLFPFFFQLFLFFLFFWSQIGKDEVRTQLEKKKREVIPGKLGPNPASLMRFLWGNRLSF